MKRTSKNRRLDLPKGVYLAARFTLHVLAVANASVAAAKLWNGRALQVTATQSGERFKS